MSVQVGVYEVDEFTGQGNNTRNYRPQIRGSGTAGAATEISLLNPGTQVDVSKTVVLFRSGFGKPQNPWGLT
jgi:hypothetical protein